MEAIFNKFDPERESISYCKRCVYLLESDIIVGHGYNHVTVYLGYEGSNLALIVPVPGHCNCIYFVGVGLHKIIWEYLLYSLQ